MHNKIVEKATKYNNSNKKLHVKTIMEIEGNKCIHTEKYKIV